MGTILASAVITDVGAILDDPGWQKWTRASHLVRLNNAQRMIVTMKPEANVNQASTQLAAGTRQSIPTGGIALIDVPRNMGTDGSTVGDAITVADKESADALVPDWQNADSSATVLQFMFDLRDPAKFYVYPPQPSANQGYVDIVYSYTPAEVAAVGNAISLDDIYKGVLVDLICYQALAGENDPVKQQRAYGHLQSAEKFLGYKESKEAQNDPNR